MFFLSEQVLFKSCLRLEPFSPGPEESQFLDIEAHVAQHPRHLVLATGLYGSPYIPKLGGFDRGNDTCGILRKA